MNRADLLTYARHQFGIQPSYEWAGYRDDCVLKSPTNGQWFALFADVNREQVGVAGQGNVSIMDVRYDEDPTDLFQRAGVIKPVRMSGHWVGVILDEHTDAGLVHRLLSRAFTNSLKEQRPQQEHLIHVPSQHEQTVYQDAPIPHPVRHIPFAKHSDPANDRINKMERLYDYTRSPLTGRAENFVHQGKYMADFTIETPPFHGRINRFYATYHDLSPWQLEGYFGWRTKARRGSFESGPTTFAYLYLYEIINQIGVSSPQDGLQKLRQFAKQGLPKFDSQSLKRHFQQWQRDYVIYYQLDQTTIQQCFSAEIEADQFMSVLLTPNEHDHHELTNALWQLGSYHLDHCPLYKTDLATLEATVARVWLKLTQDQQFDVARNFLGWQTSTIYRPFGDAVFLDQAQYDHYVCQIDPIRTVTCQKGQWRLNYYMPIDKRSKRIGTLLHEVDRLLRQAYHCGRQLTPKALDQHFLQVIQQSIKEAHQEVLEERRPKITINLGHLDQIRADASITRESLLTDEERQLENDDQEEVHQAASLTSAASVSEPSKQPTTPTADHNDLGLTADEWYLLVHLLNGQEWQAHAQAQHWLVSVIADGINEKLFDEIGDTVIEFDDQDQPQVVDDYRDDLKELLSQGD